MANDIIADILTSIQCKILPEDLTEVRNRIATVVTNYHCEFVGTALSTEVDIYPAFYKAYMVNLKVVGCSVLTIQNYHSILTEFFMNINKPVDQLSSSDIIAYLYTLQAKTGISDRTLNQKRSCINTFFEWARNEQYVATNPCRTIKPIKYEVKEREPLTKYELDLLRSACKNPRDRAIVEFFYSTGCRVSEATRVNIADIDRSSKSITVFGKGKKYGKVFLTDYAIKYLDEYLKTREDNDEALFVSNVGQHTRLSVDGFQKIFKSLGEDAGINRRVHPHLMRHTMATSCLRSGMSVDKVQKMLRHSSIGTTLIYAKTDINEVQHDHDKYIV